MKQVFFIAGLILGLATAVFALQNAAIVQVHFLFWQTEGPLAVVVLAAALAGLLAALCLGLPVFLNARRKIRGLERRLAGGSPESAARPMGQTPEEGSSQ
jgi:uncharacterized integral membrane protein